MNIFGSIFRGGGSQADRQAAAFTESFWREIGLAHVVSKAGNRVTVKTALQVMAVFACIRVVSEDVAQVSRGLFKKLKKGGNEEAAEHPLYELFLRRVNHWQTPFEFLEMLVIHTMLAGRFICFINRVGTKIIELVPFQPHEVKVECDAQRRLVYRVTAENGQTKDYPPEAIWHVKGPSYTGWDGMEVMNLAREAIGLSIATEEAHALMHSNGAQAGGVYSVEGSLSKEQYRKMRDWISANLSGENRFKPMVLDRGAKFLQTAMTGVDAQHLETRRYQLEEVCRAFRVMPLMIGFADKTSTFASAEQMFDAHVKYTLGGWFKRIEESIGANLLTREEWLAGHYFKFKPQSLLRGSSKDRGEFYQKLWSMGALNANQIRDMEEMNPYDGGDVYRVQLNTTDASKPAPDPAAQQQQQNPGSQEEGDDKKPEKNRARLNAGRVLSALNEGRIRDAQESLQLVLDDLGTEKQE